MQEHPFTEAPALYSFNVPKYLNILLRAQEFAKEHNKRLSWCYAVDVPLHAGDRELAEDALLRKLQGWLSMHDQKTNHLASVFPLVEDLPVRLTDSIDRDRGLYKGRRGRIRGWTRHPDDVPIELNNGECILTHMPLAIYVYFEGATWRIGQLPVGVYPLTPKTRKWQVNKGQGIEARRTGYLLLPDFCSTAHMIQGATLEAAFWGSHDANQNIAPAEQIAGYVVLGRVKHLHRMCILQPFSPLLFSRGPPQGPAILLKKLQGEYSVREALDAWPEAPAADHFKAQSLDPMEQKYRCMSCHLQNKPSDRPLAEFGITDRKRFYADFITQGSWTRCVCCTTAKKLPTPESVVNLQHHSASGQESSDKATKLPTPESAANLQHHSAFRQELPDNATQNCIQCSEQFIGVQLQLNHHVCGGCRREFPRDHWPVNGVKMHQSWRKTALICRGCAAKGCTPRDANLYDCQECAQKLGSTRFDTQDLRNRGRPERHKEVLICGCDTNSCSTMTTLKLVTLLFF